MIFDPLRQRRGGGVPGFGPRGQYPPGYVRPLPLVFFFILVSSVAIPGTPQEPDMIQWAPSGFHGSVAARLHWCCDNTMVDSPGQILTTYHPLAMMTCSLEAHGCDDMFS